MFHHPILLLCVPALSCRSFAGNQEALALCKACSLNLSICYLNLKQYSSCVVQCDEVLAGASMVPCGKVRARPHMVQSGKVWAGARVVRCDDLDRPSLSVVQVHCCAAAWAVVPAQHGLFVVSETRAYLGTHHGPAEQLLSCR